MLVHRRIALACAIGALAVTPGTAAGHARHRPAAARVLTDVGRPDRPRGGETGSDTTLALVLSGSALLIAAGTAALSGHDHRRLGRVA